MNNSSRSRGWLLVPPPLLFVLPLLLGLFLQARMPLVHVPETIAEVLRWLGIVLILVGAAHAFSSVLLFIRSRTTVIPHHRSSALVTQGAYRWTRNPMYVGLTFVYIGIAALSAAVWPLLLLPLPLLVIDRWVIPREERQLEEVFGSDYTTYRQRVRRWL